MNRVWRAAFIVYALLLTLGTLWPKFEVRGPVSRTDLWVHAAAFGCWTVLLYASGLMGERRLWRTVVLTVLVSLAWAGLDEWAQQFVQRHTAADDFAANTAGVWLGGVASALWCARLNRARADR